MRAPVSLVALLVCASVWFGTDIASAQSFSPRTFTGTRQVFIGLGSRELVWDRGSGGGRYARSLTLSRRILGNAAMNTIQLVPSEMNIRTEVMSGVGDRIELGWGDLAPSALRNGTSLATFGISASLNRRLQSPGALFRFVSDVELQASGWNFDRANVTTGSVVLTEATLQPYERLSLLLMDTDDLVDMRVPGSSTRDTSLALWTQRNSSVTLWARCNALPTATAFDFRQAAAGTSSAAAFLTLPRTMCGTGTWFVTVTSTTATPLMVQMHMGVRNPAGTIADTKVGIAFTPTATQMTQIRDTLEQAAWRLYGATGGTRLYTVFHIFGTSACDDGWPADEYACGGGGCRICIQDEPGRSNCNAEGRGRVDLMGDDWGAANVGAGAGGPGGGSGGFTGGTLAHEMGHCPIGLRDEYHDTDACASHGVSWDLCGRSTMGLYFSDNINSLCTATTHRTVGEACTSTGCAPVAGPNSSCNGGLLWTNERPAWDSLALGGTGYDNLGVPVTHPTNRDPDNFSYLNFARDTQVIGQVIFH